MQGSLIKVKRSGGGEKGTPGTMIALGPRDVMICNLFNSVNEQGKIPFKNIHELSDVLVKP